MKKLLLTLKIITFIILFINVLSFAKDSIYINNVEYYEVSLNSWLTKKNNDFFSKHINLLLTGEKWKKMNPETSLYYNWQEAFLELYEITQKEPENERAFLAAGLMRKIRHSQELALTIRSPEAWLPGIRKLWISLIFDPFSANNSVFDADYFYAGLFIPVKKPFRDPITGNVDNKHFITDERPFDSFKTLIEKFPDSPYTKLAYLFLADNYREINKQDEAIKVLNEFIKKYSEKDELAPYAYLSLVKAHGKLFSADNKNEASKKNGELALKYANKIINDYPKKINLVGPALIELGNYYLYAGSEEKALEYYYKVYNDDKVYYAEDIHGAMKALADLYIGKKEYEKLDKLLEDSRSRFSQYQSFRITYKELKRIVKEIALFGFDESQQKLEDLDELKRRQIDTFRRRQYNECFDENFNLIKSLDDIKVTPERLLTPKEPGR